MSDGRWNNVSCLMYMDIKINIFIPVALSLLFIGIKVILKSFWILCRLMVILIHEYFISLYCFLLLDNLPEYFIAKYIFPFFIKKTASDHRTSKKDLSFLSCFLLLFFILPFFSFLFFFFLVIWNRKLSLFCWFWDILLSAPFFDMIVYIWTNNLKCHG